MGMSVILALFSSYAVEGNIIPVSECLQPVQLPTSFSSYAVEGNIIPVSVYLQPVQLPTSFSSYGVEGNIIPLQTSFSSYGVEGNIIPVSVYLQPVQLPTSEVFVVLMDLQESRQTRWVSGRDPEQVDTSSAVAKVVPAVVFTVDLHICLVRVELRASLSNREYNNEINGATSSKRRSGTGDVLVLPPGTGDVLVLRSGTGDVLVLPPGTGDVLVLRPGTGDVLILPPRHRRRAGTAPRHRRRAESEDRRIALKGFPAGCYALTRPGKSPSSSKTSSTMAAADLNIRSSPLLPSLGPRFWPLSPRRRAHGYVALLRDASSSLPGARRHTTLSSVHDSVEVHLPPAKGSKGYAGSPKIMTGTGTPLMTRVISYMR
ncbi:hypothetical protein Bbelb_051380 [Branchiostoma belcheri]|nr:hypothetical protein Bbelb_051380 [Branchiostoma belcheri]